MRFDNTRSPDRKNPWQDDVLHRRDEGTRLSRILTEIHAPARVTVEAEYGQGKTFLLDRVALELEQTGALVVRLNAWTDNVVGEPSAAIAGALIDTLSTRGLSQLPASADKLFRRILAVAPKLSLKAVSNGASGGIGLNEVAGTVTAEPGNPWVPIRPSEIADAREAIKAEIRSLHAQTNPDNPPRVYLIVDDLDRCRPDELIEFMERARHVFDLENWVFVFAVSPEALSGSVNRVYGITGADAFLRRFVDYRYPLSPPSLEQYLRSWLVSNGYSVGDGAHFSTLNALAISMASQNWRANPRAGLRDLDKAFPPLGKCLEALVSDRQILMPLLLSLFFYRHFHRAEYDANTHRNIAFRLPQQKAFTLALYAPAAADKYADLMNGSVLSARGMLDARRAHSLTDHESQMLMSSLEWSSGRTEEECAGAKIVQHHRRAIRELLG